ncbi:maleylpyruvate isomerase family mycothiol-dependent enzyme [Amnibacterium kyonggiense]
MALLATTTAAFADEIERQDPATAVAWPRWPDVAALVGHLGGVHRWAARVVATGERIAQPADRPAPADARRWFLAGRDELIGALRAADPEDPCWVFAGPDRTAGFWLRRMLFETAKHLVDLRAAGGGGRRAPRELGAGDCADGIDELVTVFLDRSRPVLAPLSRPVRLVALDVDRSWTFTTDWHVGDEPADGAAEVRARAADLALLVWQRADPLRSPDRFRVTGPREVVTAFAAAPVQP